MSALFLDLISVLVVFFAVLVITASNPVHIVVGLISVFVIAACYLLILGVGFVGLSYLIVYVGAVAVIFICVVILLNIQVSDITITGTDYTRNLPLGFVAALAFIFELLSVVPTASSRSGELAVGLFNSINSSILNLNSNFITSSDIVNQIYNNIIPDQALVGISQVEALGISLYTNGSIWLIIISIVLLLSIIGPIVLCIQPRPYREPVFKVDLYRYDEEGHDHFSIIL